VDNEQEVSELKYLKIIEEIKEKQPDIYEKIKKLPKKARSSKKIPNNINCNINKNTLLSFIKIDKLKNFILLLIVMNLKN